jgi:hypothetical protein
MIKILTKPIVKSAVVITPTIGKPELLRCMQSVRSQTFGAVKHLVVVDGALNKERFDTVFLDYMHTKEMPKPVDVVTLQENVGANNWYGHRVYAAFSYLVNADVVLYLDEDNWFEPNHVEKLMEVINENDLDWSFSFRKIVDKDGTYLCHDNCESLGIHPVYFNDAVYHIDTSSFAIRSTVAVRAAPAWYGQWGQDRVFFDALKRIAPEYAPSKEHSLCYRLDGNTNSVTKEFFDTGNKIMHERYQGNLPWHQ